MNFKKNSRAFIAMAFFLASSSAYANYVCTGEVVGVAISPKNDHIYANSIGPIVWPMLCSVSQTSNNISPEACKQVYSLLLTAQIAKKKVTLWFNDDATGGNCNSHAAWQLLTGWYFGPELLN